jgi:hypothetical protein
LEHQEGTFDLWSREASTARRSRQEAAAQPFSNDKYAGLGVQTLGPAGEEAFKKFMAADSEPCAK